jgi:hypothetical protein
MSLYNPEFPVGTLVRILGKIELDRFSRDWKYHHPLQPNQLSFAGQVATVTKVSFYHGGDVLYELSEIPGTWHERCLRGAGTRTSKGRSQINPSCKGTPELAGCDANVKESKKP